MEASMPRNPSRFAKLQRERERQQKRQERNKRKAERRDQKLEEDASKDPAVDDDIAHIVPGPQPLPWMDEEGEEDAGAGDVAAS